jgi:acid phosphatase type 7
MLGQEALAAEVPSDVGSATPKIMLTRKGVFGPVSVSAVLALLLAACEGNISGDLAAERFGDLSNPPAQRLGAASDVADGCALAAGAEPQPAPPLVGGLKRQPYLQQLTSASVEILWTALPETAPTTLVVTAGDGGPVATIAGTRDETAWPVEGASLFAAKVSGLQAETSYCYELRTDTGTVLARSGFQTAPEVGAQRPVRFIAFGDSGNGSEDQRAVFAQMRTVPFDFVIHTGDIAYSSGRRTELEHTFFDIYGSVLDGTAVFPVSGNHEYDTEGAAPFREVFSLPENGGPLGRERWYSFDWGPVHFVALDTERTGPEQAAWLDADLGANRLPWTIVLGHKPPFSSGEHGNDGPSQKYFVPLFEKHYVPLVLNGHDHDYERSLPQNGVTYVVTGGGGTGTRPVGTSFFTAFSESVIHFVYVTIEGDTLALHAIDGMGTEFDSAVIRR